ncbi:hypothetical protein SKAU_G00224480 [Synaphobranchus kaupii]|uniref:Uncharacterized protein n=1 Tax=Synaphobranchus kaupii TaxID=118154 RepID=A0A9Q1FBC9_SYNKA|nr:hypothetical protein SKAU_G00224480 [Synaphobranchus kaupii]
MAVVYRVQNMTMVPIQNLCARPSQPTQTPAAFQRAVLQEQLGLQPMGDGHHGPGSGGPNSWWGMTEDAKTTILHLRESLVQQKETILDQRETIRELTAKLTLCEGFGRGVGGHDDHHGPHLTHHPYPDHSQGHHGNHIPDPLYPLTGHRSDSHHRKAALGGGDKHRGDMISSSPEQMGRMLQSPEGAIGEPAAVQEHIQLLLKLLEGPSATQDKCSRANRCTITLTPTVEATTPH